VASGPIWSERFFYSEVSQVWKGVSVPEDYRAVIKCVTFVNNTGTAALAFLKVHGVLVIDDSIPAASSLIRTGLHIPVYERESMEAFFYFATGACSVSGFLFKDAGARVTFPPTASHRAPLPDHSGDPEPRATLRHPGWS
jgi:hypothetical protein